MVECRYYSVMEKLASLAKIKLSELEVNPLYYVWDQWGPLREPGEPRTIDIASLHVSLKEGYVRVPWRGGKLEEA
jgi:Asp-tRNA(Asn)/Glu-tRNA(Gln) amidotransferase C subunit